MALTSAQIFAFILSKSKRRVLKTNSPTEWHKVFYSLYENNKDLMQGFDFKKTTNPYSLTLQELLKLFQMGGILTPAYSGANFLGYRVNAKKLKELLPENTTEMSKGFKGLKELEKLFVNV